MNINSKEYLQSRRVRYTHKLHEREHSKHVNRIFNIYIYSMQELAIISRQANNSTKREGVGRIGLCYHPHFSHFHHAKKTTNKAH